MVKTISITGGILLSSLGPVEDSVRQQDPYASCSSYHWAVVNYARDTQDLERMWRHLRELSALAGRLAAERRISVDGAHSILQRAAEARLSTTHSSEQARILGDDGACALLTRRTKR